MIQDFIDMDTQQKVSHYVSESSNTSTSGYSTMSSGAQFGNVSPGSAGYSLPSSPADSPGTAALPVEFSQLNLPQTNFMHVPHYQGNATLAQQQQQHASVLYTQDAAFMHFNTLGTHEQQYAASLRILEHPVEKFRFRYKSEMHGTHGSLNGANSKRTPKTFPEVELCNFRGPAVIRCSLFQANLDSPHSHQLVVRKDDQDICDPHDLAVCSERGYIVQFQNMGIIHTAKKFIMKELLHKKRNRLLFALGRHELSTKETQELHKETEREAKEMNLNQVRLCFEAFQVNDNVWTPIAAPVFTNPINNRKSAQTGDLRICRLSITTGSVNGDDELILLVEKVSKKNIKVRFFELNEDEEVVWAAYGKFRETDVHHQFAIFCHTPPYKDKNIDKPVEVHIELVRPSDDERSYPPVTFRYKPRENLASRKRPRTYASENMSLSSTELPKTVQEAEYLMPAPSSVLPLPQQQVPQNAPTISEEFNKDQELQKLINSEDFAAFMTNDSEELSKFCPQNLSDLCFELEPNANYEINPNSNQGRLETDGAPLETNENQLQKICKIYNNIRSNKNISTAQIAETAKLISQLYVEYAEQNALGDSLLHDIIAQNNIKLAIKICQLLHYFRLQELLNRLLNERGESVLHYACLHNHAHYIRPLLGLGCDANIQDRQGDTCLHIAVREQQTQCLESCLRGKQRLQLRLRNDAGLTALHLAIRLQNLEIVENLLKYDASVAAVSTTKDGNNALHMAVIQQNVPLIRLIFAHCDEQLLLVRNAAGQRVAELAKHLAAQVGGKFLSALQKEESSISVKEEEEELSTCSEAEEEQVARDLAKILADKSKLHKLIKLLDEANKWQTLARKCQLAHLLCLWSNASDMLKYISSDISSLKFEQFAKALAEVDCDALEVLQIKS